VKPPTQELSSRFPPVYGSKDWANYLLKEGIRTLQDKQREPGSRALEVLCQIDLLRSRGFWWQADRLQNWLHLYWWELRPSKQPEPERETSRQDFQTSRDPSLRPQGRPSDKEEEGHQ
jgi:hypothetical protein